MQTIHHWPTIYSTFVRTVDHEEPRKELHHKAQMVTAQTRIYTQTQPSPTREVLDFISAHPARISPGKVYRFTPPHNLTRQRGWGMVVQRAKVIHAIYSLRVFYQG